MTFDLPESGEPRYSVSAVARRLGIPPATLRTWDRRYGLGPADHSSGGHRRYTPGDLARLVTMRRLMLDGVPAGVAARLARTSTGVDGESAPGGSVALPSGEPAVEHRREVSGLVRAALSLDAGAASAVVSRAVRERGAVAAWTELLAPALEQIGDRWSRTGEGIDAEHLLSEAAVAALREAAAPAASLGEPRALLACAADDYHALAVHALAAALTERGVAVRSLGAAVPSEALATAVRRVRPRVVFCWSSMPATGNPAYLAAIPALAPPVAVLVGGPGWQDAVLPVGVRRVDGLAAAASAVTSAVGG